MIACGFAGGIRRGGGVRCGFTEEISGAFQIAVNFIGGDVMETEFFFRIIAERVEVLPCGFEQRIGSDDIGLDEFSGPVDGTVHMGFRGEMHDDIRLKIREDPVHCRLVADVRFLETAAGIAGNAFKGFQISGICQFVDDADLIPGHMNNMPYDSRTYESGSASYDNFISQRDTLCNIRYADMGLI